MAVQHNAITDPDIHEPKGASTASADQIYVSDGTGSGDWTDLSDLYYTGWSLFVDNAYTATSGVYLSIGTSPTLVTVNKLGTGTDETQAPVDATATLFNASTNLFQPINTGDLYSLQLSFTIQAVSGSPSTLTLDLAYTNDDDPAVTTVIAQKVEPAPGAGAHICCINMVPAIADLVSFGGKIRLTADSGTISIKDIKLLITRIHKAR